MNANCPHCGIRFEREPGYWLGSIYFNYGLTAMIVTASYFAFYFSEVLPQWAVMAILLAFCVVFPLWFFRYARCIWMAFDLYLDPREAPAQHENQTLRDTDSRGKAE